MASDIGRHPQSASDELAYGIFVHGRRNAPALSPMSSPSSPTRGSAELAIVASCSPTPPLSNQVELSRIQMTTGLLASDIGRHPQSASDELAYGTFVHGRRK